MLETKTFGIPMPAALPLSRPGSCLLVAATACFIAAPSYADIVISNGAMQNMSCSGGICAPTAANAVLNVTDLENLLASGNVEVTTTGSGVQADDIEVDAAFSWSSTNTLAFDAYESITIDKPVAISGLSGLSLTTNDGGSGGTLLFGAKGNVTLANLASQLTINGLAYTLVNTLPVLASAIAANPSGAFALAASYNASADGTYSSSPVSTTFTGSFEGLGNAISNLSIDDTAPDDQVGLFGYIASQGVVTGIVVSNLRIVRASTGYATGIGGLAGQNLGTVINAYTTGSVDTRDEPTGSGVGGLVGLNYGTITFSGSSVSIAGDDYNIGGGLVGTCEGTIVESYATGSVSTGKDGYAGGLGSGCQTVAQSYARGSVSTGSRGARGTVLSANGGTVSQSYGTGPVTLGSGGYQGGFVGFQQQGDSITAAFWGVTTSNIPNLNRGAGNIRHYPGITGLTTTQLQSGLPAGFDPKVWAEDPKINDGLPYLIANPPRK
jgi:hypothetical protein